MICKSIIVFPLWEHNTWDNEDLLQPQRLMTIRPGTQSSLKVARKGWCMTGPYLLGQQAQFQSWSKEDEQCSQACLQTEHLHNHFYCIAIIKCTALSLSHFITHTDQHTPCMKIKQCTHKLSINIEMHSSTSQRERWQPTGSLSWHIFFGNQ